MHWDFALILLFFATAVPLLGRRRVRRLMNVPHTTRKDRLVLYASTVAFQWAATAVILWRARAHAISAADLGITIPNPALTAIITVLLAALIFANQIVSLKRLAAGIGEIKGVLPQLALKIFPQDTTERLAFVVVVATVAVCEEVIYRGFAQHVFQNWSGGYVAVGIFASAAIFSVAHLYQGRRGLISTLIVGILFSAVRAWTGSLLPPLVSHFIADLTAGFLAPSQFRIALAKAEASTSAPLEAPDETAST